MIRYIYRSLCLRTKCRTIKLHDWLPILSRIKAWCSIYLISNLKFERCYVIFQPSLLFLPNFNPKFIKIFILQLTVGQPDLDPPLILKILIIPLTIFQPQRERRHTSRRERLRIDRELPRFSPINFWRECTGSRNLSLSLPLFGRRGEAAAVAFSSEKYFTALPPPPPPLPSNWLLNKQRDTWLTFPSGEKIGRA